MSLQNFRILLYLSPIFEPTFSLLSKKKGSLILNRYDAGGGRVMIAPRGRIFVYSHTPYTFANNGKRGR